MVDLHSWLRSAQDRLVARGRGNGRGLRHPSDRRIFAIAQYLHAGTHRDQLHGMDIDRWFLERLNNIVKGANDLKSTGKLADVDDDGMLKLKKLGFSDIQIGKMTGDDEDTVRAARRRSA